MQLEQPLQLLLGHLVALDLGNVCMAEIDHVHVQCVDQNLVVHIEGALWDRKERVLADEVFQPEVSVRMLCTIVEWVLIGEKLTGEWLVAELRWVVQSLHHVSLLSLVPEQPSCRLILVHKGELTSCLVQQNLVYHAVSAPRVNDHSVNGEPPEGNHDGQHDWVGAIEGILLDQHGQHGEGNQEASEQ